MVSTTNDVVVIPDETALTVFTQPNGLNPYLAKVRTELDAFTPDTGTKKGRDEIASIAYKVSRIKTYLDGVGKQLADQQKEIPKKIDAARKLSRDTLDRWRDEVRKPLTDWEQVEKERVDLLTKMIAWYADTGLDHSGTSSDIRKRLEKVVAGTVDELIYAEHFQSAVNARQKAIELLTQALSMANVREAEQAELERLRKAEAERQEQERAAKAAQEAADKARQAAEELAAASIQAAESAARKATQAAEEAAAAANRELEALKRKAEAEQAEAERRRRDREHAAKVNTAAKEAFMAGGIPADVAMLAVQLIAKRKIPAVTINY